MPDVQQAFAAYEQLRRERVERVVAQGARASSGEKSFTWMYDYHIDRDERMASQRTLVPGRRARG